MAGAGATPGVNCAVRAKRKSCETEIPCVCRALARRQKRSLDVVDDRFVRVQLETPLHYSLLTSFFWNTCFVVVASLSC